MHACRHCCKPTSKLGLATRESSRNQSNLISHKEQACLAPRRARLELLELQQSLRAGAARRPERRQRCRSLPVTRTPSPVAAVKIQKTVPVPPLPRASASRRGKKTSPTPRFASQFTACSTAKGSMVSSLRSAPGRKLKVARARRDDLPGRRAVSALLFLGRESVGKSSQRPGLRTTAIEAIDDFACSERGNMHMGDASSQLDPFDHRAKSAHS